MVFYAKICRAFRDRTDPLLGAGRRPEHLVESEARKLPEPVSMVTLEGLRSFDESPAGRTWRFLKSTNTIITIGLKTTIDVKSRGEFEYFFKVISHLSENGMTVTILEISDYSRGKNSIFPPSPL